MLDELPVRYYWSWEVCVTPKNIEEWRQLYTDFMKGEQRLMDQEQRESDLKALRKIREVIEEGRIGKALVLINRVIQDKAMPESAAVREGWRKGLEAVERQNKVLAEAGKVTDYRIDQEEAEKQVRTEREIDDES